MNLKNISVILLLLSGAAIAGRAQNAAEIEALKKQLQQLQSDFEKVEREHRESLDALRQRIEGLSKNPADAQKPATADAQRKKLEQELAAELQPAPGTATNAPVAPLFSPGWSASQPIPIARAGSAYMNVSFDALMDAGFSSATDPSQRLNLGDHDPIKRGFSFRNAEIGLDGAVDPYFKGFANIVFKLDKNDETEIELEEVYAQTTGLSHNLQAKAGQFFANFGRQNPQHPHQWAFVDQPLILTRVFGPDGLRGIGGQISWLMPTPFYSEVFLGAFDGQGGTAFNFRNPGEDDGTGINRFRGRATTDRTLRGPGDLLFTPRIATSAELSDSQTIVAGISGAFGPNDSGPHSRTEIYGADVYWKWKPEKSHGGFPFVSWQTEALYGRYGLGADVPALLPAENMRDWGFYSQVSWGFRPRWVASFRGDYVSGNGTVIDPLDPFRGERTRLSPVITWYPSEFAKLRLQYNYDHGQFIGTEHSLWMQFEFQLGAHSAHKF